MFGLNNPNRLRQPWKNVKQFSEELYAMFTSKAPVEHEGPVTIRVKEGQTALRLVQGESDRGQIGPGPAIRTPRARPAPQPPSPFGDATRAVPARRPDLGEAAHAPTPAKRPKPLLSVEGGIDFKGKEPVRFDTPPEIRNPETGQYEPVVKPPFDYSEPPHKDNVLATKTGGGGGLVGVVTGGTGSTWSVDLYDGGPGGEQGESISVNIPMIADDEDAPVGLWLFGIASRASSEGEEGENVYSFQVPVWLE